MLVGATCRFLSRCRRPSCLNCMGCSVFVVFAIFFPFPFPLLYSSLLLCLKEAPLGTWYCPDCNTVQPLPTCNRQHLAHRAALVFASFPLSTPDVPILSSREILAKGICWRRPLKLLNILRGSLGNDIQACSEGR
jgi:hypothetical protein